MTELKKKRIVVLAPHTDDGEFGCGGTINKYVEEGHDVYYFAFSSCEESVPEGMEKDVLIKEVKAATQVLGIPPENLTLFKFPVRKFPEFRQEILEEMVTIQRDLKPDMVLLPTTNDTHQDHVTVAHEGFRAFKRTTMLGYEVPWNNLQLNTSCFVCLDKAHIEKKVEALKCYESQLFRSYASEDFVLALAKVRGTQIGVPHAEVFEAVRWVVR
jgi:LmbE family N-acetylglucosaminyl deacetylase